MGIFYKILGVFAGMNESLSRQSINFIPLNIGIMVLAGAGTFILGSIFIKDATENKTFQEVALKDVVSGKVPEGSYIIVKGMVAPKFGLRYVTTTKSGEERSVDNAFAPMMDRKTRRIIFVDLVNKDLKSQKNEVRVIKGKITEIHSALKAELMKKGNKFKRIKPDTKHMIEEGATPGNAILSGAGAFACGSVLFLFVLTSMKRYTVFRKTSGSPETLAPLGADEEIDLSVTGHFWLEGKTRKYFVNMPAAMGQLETGETAFFSNIDASSNFMGFTTKKRKGIWDLTASRGSIRKVERGILYYSSKSRPSLRIEYEDANSKGSRKEKTIISCRREAEREAILRDLQAGGETVTGIE